MSESSTGPTEPDNGQETDQDAEPTLNAPGNAGPTGIDADAEGSAVPDEAGDQDAGPSQNTPSE